MTTVQSMPRSARARGKAPATSANPPVLANPATSDAAYTQRSAFMLIRSVQPSHSADFARTRRWPVHTIGHLPAPGNFGVQPLWIFGVRRHDAALDPWSAAARRRFGCLDCEG